MQEPSYRAAIRDYIRRQANPPDKFSHQSRLYLLARKVAAKSRFDDDVLFAAAWLHDLGVFIGHRPKQTAEVAKWDHIAYAVRRTPALLKNFGFPAAKIPGAIEAIRTHLPASSPSNVEGVILRDADILEQLGAVGILRTVSKVGRDTRFILFSDALDALERNLKNLPGKLRLASAKKLAKARTATLARFLEAARKETGSTAW